MPKVHVLNGDALLHQFPESVEGERLVMRECLIEGPVNADSLDSFYKDRIAFLTSEYKATEKDYQIDTIEQFNRLSGLADDFEINLWFEQDLFCQVNLWFICNYLVSHKKINPVFLMMPETFSNYGFGALDGQDLKRLYEKRKPFNQLHEFANLWQFYRFDQDADLSKLANDLSKSQAYLVQTVQAHLDRRRTKDSLGRPMDSLINIIRDLKTTDFKIVFREFCSREGIYGYGDSQVKKIYDKILDNKLHELG